MRPMSMPRIDPDAGPVTLASRLRETGGYGVASLLLVAMLVGAGFMGRGPVADGVVLATTVAALVVMIATATARGRARLAIVAGAGLLAAIVIAANPVGVRPILGLAWLAVLAISTIGLIAVTADLLGSRRVSVRLLAGTVCLYILLGYAWATAYALIEALSGVPFLAQVEKSSFMGFLYFSFATITTTGFGDVTASDQPWRLFVVAEALVGQLYLVVVIGAFVGASRLASLREGRPDDAPRDEGAAAPPVGPA
jgi:hypothetical protein